MTSKGIAKRKEVKRLKKEFKRKYFDAMSKPNSLLPLVQFVNNTIKK